jgi:thioredoxin reductase
VNPPDSIDTLIVGGGPAGLTAALWLARFRRTVRVVDAGEPRNEPTWAVHGYPGLPEIPPLELRRLIRDQALGAGAEIVRGRIVRIEGEKDAFRVLEAEGAVLEARRVLLAFGLRDRLPEVKGIERFYGNSVFHCPDCDGPSMAGAHVVVLGASKGSASVALRLSHWAETVTMIANGEETKLDTRQMEVLERAGITIRQERIVELVGEDSRMTGIELGNGETHPAEGMFFSLGADPASSLSEQLECDTENHGLVCVDASGETSIPGVYAAGDIAAGHPHLAIAAAAEGARAALTIHRSLLPAWKEI